MAIIYYLYNYALQPLRLIVRSGLDVPNFATRHLYACHQSRAPSGETMGKKCPVILPTCRFPRYIQGSFTCCKATTWDRRLYFPSEGRRAEDFFALKIRRLRPGVNTRTWVPKASTLPLDHRRRLMMAMIMIIHDGQMTKIKCGYQMHSQCAPTVYRIWHMTVLATVNARIIGLRG